MMILMVTVNYDDDSDDHSGDGVNDVVMILWTRMPAQLRVYDDNGDDTKY